MAADEECDQHLIDHLVLTHDDAAHLLDDPGFGLLEPLDASA